MGFGTFGEYESLLLYAATLFSFLFSGQGPPRRLWFRDGWSLNCICIHPQPKWLRMYRLSSSLVFGRICQLLLAETVWQSLLVCLSCTRLFAPAKADCSGGSPAAAGRG